MDLRNNRLRFAANIALFAALALLAWKTGGKVYQDGPQLEISQRGDAVVLEWPHEVTAPMAKRFADAFDEWGGRTGRFIIELDSPGGALIEGRLVIAEIEKAKAAHIVETHVGAGRRCLSMCVPIYLTGEARTAARDAKFMFHEPTTRDLFTDEVVDEPGFERRMTAEKFFKRYFVNSPMTPEWRESLRASWRGRDVWFTAEQLVEQQSGVVERVE
ncbi:MAG: hypothetical protein KDA46_11605 [Parvularculaceae bacterium]|nr:hypothetical protein [Parvularculaceae bacterium]